ncbi:MAG: hypothetical protein ACO2OR_02445 [Desulfurococcaceae archaeon]
MSEYIKQLKVQIASKVRDVKFKDHSPLEISVLKEGFPEIRVRDERDYVILTISGNQYKYDKWYTKPEHLAEMIKVYYTKSA